ncbi:MAG: hypothetical protein FJW14_09530 [Acidimicrobiia bacterium]|nr:hypothetical protein [Acidimicrobiia bacterium]
MLQTLKSAVKRGALIAAANWQVTLIQATADSLFKLLLASPVIGGVFLVALAIGAAPDALITLGWREMAATIVATLLSRPLVLTAFLLAVGVVAVGGSFFVFLVKAGTVATLVRSDRDAGAIEDPPLRVDMVARASRFSVDGYIQACRSLFPRYARLGVILMGIYAASGASYLAVVANRIGGEGWAITTFFTAVFIAWITIVNLLYLLMQIVIAADDCSVAAAAPRVAAFLRRQRRMVGAIFLLVLGLVVGATGASLLATAALGLVAFVPLVGLAALPLQLLAWLLRGLVFQYLGLTSVGAYLKVYREKGVRPPYTERVNPLSRPVYGGLTPGPR